MARNQKLELQWIGKDQRPRLEPRILLEDPELSYHAAHRVRANDIFEHRVIVGDNLLALRALEQELTGKVGCVYIDPPYNTGSAFFSYEDGLEHSLWLSMMRDRLQLLWRLLDREEGVLLISINDDEAHYLKVLCDELFGRGAFVATLVWNYEGNTDNQAKIINYHEYVLVYSHTGRVQNPRVFDPTLSQDSKVFRPEIRNTIVKNGRKNPLKSVLIPKGFPAAFESGTIARSDVNYPQYDQDLQVASGVLQHVVTATTGWSSRELLEEFIRSGFVPVKDTKGQLTRFELTKTGAIEGVKSRVQEKGHFLSVLRGFGTTNQMRLLLEKLGIAFTYPKPVNLIAYLVEAFSSDDAIVLDSFAGSGTTGHAVMQLNREKESSRRFILVELDETTYRNVTLPRLKAVVDGNSDAGLAQHGGGFRAFRLAPSLIETDKWGNPVINKTYNAGMLAEALCKLEGFTYAPNEVYWQQGYSTERDFIFVTTQQLTRDQLQALSDEVGDDRTLLVCCAAFRAKSDAFPNLTIKKIPHAVLSRCEWGHDDYSLQVSNLPAAIDFDFSGDSTVKRQQGKAKKTEDSLSLFDTAPTK
jgi:adenine-specific DNA-methyltransferase